MRKKIFGDKSERKVSYEKCLHSCQDNIKVNIHDREHKDMIMSYQADEWEEWLLAYVNTVMNFCVHYNSANFVPEERAGTKRLCCTD